MSRSSQHGRTSSVSASRARFEDAFRVYHEVEDVGKTVKASKRRARWTFSFGAQGQEHEVILVHSVMSGKKVVTYDGRTVHQTEEMSRAFSHSWHDGDHVLRVDITDLVEYGTGRGGDRMYELTLDGVPFASLPIKPVTLPPRPGFARGNVSGSGASGRPSLSDTQQRPRQRRASGGGSPGGGGWAGDEGEGQDDFDPRGSSSSKPWAVMRQQQQQPSSSPSNAADLLGAGTDNGFLGGGSGAAPVSVSAPAAAAGGFDPFTASGAAPSLPLQHQHYHHHQQQPPPDPKKLADEFGALSFAPSPTTTLFPTAPLLPQKPGNAHNGSHALVPLPDMSTFKQPPGAGLPAPGEEENGVTSTALIPAGDAQNPEVARLTATLVNLNNLERESDGLSPPVSPSRGSRRGGGNVYSRSVYTDHRSLAEMKASQSHKPQDPQAKPIFIERAIPPVAVVSPVPPGPRMMMMQQAPPPYGMGMGMAPPPGQGQGQGQAAFYGQHPSPGGLQQPPVMTMGGGGGGMGMMMPPSPAQQPVGMGMGMGMPQPPMMPQQPARPIMMGGGMGGMMAPPPLPPQPMMMGGMGPRPGQQQQPMPMQQAMQPPQQGMIPPPRGPPDNDPFRAFGL